MNGTTRRWGVIALGTLLSAGIAPHAIAQTTSSQWSAVSYGVAEYDTKNTLLLLIGGSATTKNMGFAPVVALQAYSLGYDVGGSRTSVFAVRPGAGIGYNYNGGAVSGTVGYEFSNVDNGRTPVVGAESGRGVDLAGDWEEWGTGGPLGYQALGSYNFGSQSFWGRGRVTTRVSQHGAAQTRVGVEAAYLSGPGYNAWQPGGVVEWHMAGGQIVGLAAGGKFQNTGGNAVYIRLEGLLPLLR